MMSDSTTMTILKVAVLGPEAIPSIPRVRHYQAASPPSDGDFEERTLLPIAEVVEIFENRSGKGVFLMRFGSDGTIVGDTWHPSVEEAIEQAEYEYGDRLVDWLDVSPDAQDSP